MLEGQNDYFSDSNMLRVQRGWLEEWWLKDNWFRICYGKCHSIQEYNCYSLVEWAGINKYILIGLELTQLERSIGAWVSWIQFDPLLDYNIVVKLKRPTIIKTKVNCVSKKL